MGYILTTAKWALGLLSLNAHFTSPSILDRAEFVFAFYTFEGWSGLGDPLLPHGVTCSTAGPNWARQFVNLVGHGTQLINLAVSGAVVDQTVVFTSPPDFRSQTSSFLNFVTPFPRKVAWTSSNAIFTISFGTNDVNNSYQRTVGNGTTLYSQDLDSYFVTVERLYAAGARQFVFNNVIPFDRGQDGVRQGVILQAKLRDSILEFNRQLSMKAAIYCGSKKDIKCTVFDTRALFTTVMNFYNLFGFATPDGFCASYANRYGCDVLPADPSCLGPVSSYIWKDGLHPAWAADKLWAEGLFKQLSLVT